MNTVGMLKLWFPSAISISLLNLELPIISLILSAYSLKASGDYAIALSTFMFANAFVFPLCAVVIKMKKSAETLMFSALLIATVFLVFNLGIWGFRQHITTHIAFITHVFSLSLLAVGVRRYLQGCCILEGKTALMSQASFVRVLVSVIGCFALTQFQVSIDMAAILALVAGAYTEAALLLLLVLRQGIQLHEGEHKDYRLVIAPYFSAFLMTASSLMSNIIVVICLSQVVGGKEILQYWPLTFGLICISISAVVDIESILLKILAYQPQKKQQFGFLTLLCLATPMSFVALCIVLERLDLLPAGSKTIYMNAKFFIAIIGVSTLWILRGYIRANLMNNDRLRIVNISILLAMITPLAVFYAVEVPNYGIILSLTIFSALIILELLCYVIYGIMQVMQRRQVVAE